jgi:adenine-specific DNA-methyltransferase
MQLNYFLHNPLPVSIPSFFESLSIPFNRITNQPFLHKDIFGEGFTGFKYLDFVEKIYLPLMIQEMSFQKTDNLFISAVGSNLRFNPTTDIQPDYECVFVVGIQIKNTVGSIDLNEMASITRAVSRGMKSNPVVVFFLNQDRLSIANCERTPYTQKWREGEKPGKVSILKDIDVNQPHAGHIRIMQDLDIQSRRISTFKELNEYWLTVFDTKILNQRFYRDIANWYFWASKIVKIPFDIGENKNKEELLSQALIRLLIRIIFVWFLKEKGLIPNQTFDPKFLKNNLKDFSETGKKTTFYTSILQNLFFATLNTYRNVDNTDKNTYRKFRSKDRERNNYSDEYMSHNVYRYESNFHDPDAVLDLWKDVPFLNGGLFECLDKKSKKDNTETSIDCFSDVEKKKQLSGLFIFFSKQTNRPIRRIQR